MIWQFYVYLSADTWYLKIQVHSRTSLLPLLVCIILVFPKWRDFRRIRWIQWIGQIQSCMNRDPFRVPHKHRRHFSVMVNMPDCCASDLGSIPGQVFLTFSFIKFIEFDENYGKTRLPFTSAQLQKITIHICQIWQKLPNSLSRKTRLSYCSNPYCFVPKNKQGIMELLRRYFLFTSPWQLSFGFCKLNVFVTSRKRAFFCI